MALSISKMRALCGACGKSFSLALLYGDNKKGLVCAACADAIADQVNARQRTYSRGVKADVIAHYGGHCTYCRDADLSHLQIDHAGGDGAQHRREIGRQAGAPFYQWLRKNEYPDGFQVLCKTCNWAKGVMSDAEFRRWIQIVYRNLYWPDSVIRKQ